MLSVRQRGVAGRFPSRSCSLCFMFSASCTEKKFGKKPFCTRQQLQSTPAHLERLRASQHPADRRITVLHCKHSRPCCALSICCPQSKSCPSASRTGFQPSDGLWKRKLHYIQQPATVRIKRTLPAPLDLQGWCSALPKEEKQIALLSTLQRLQPALSFLPVHRVSAVKSKQRGESSNLTQNYLRNWVEPSSHHICRQKELVCGTPHRYTGKMKTPNLPHSQAAPVGPLCLCSVHPPRTNVPCAILYLHRS